mgnify:FL=1
MGICLQQYRAVIGLFCTAICVLDLNMRIPLDNCHAEVVASFCFLTFLSLILVLVVFQNLRHITTTLYKALFSDIHPNPGPTHNILKTFSVCHANVRSIKSEGKLDELRLLAETEKIDVVTLSETWLDTSFPNDLLTIDEFQPPIRKDRESGNGGGVALYVKNHLPFTRRPDLESLNSECIWVEITSTNGMVLIGVYYRPPGQSAAERDQFIDSLSNSISTALELNPHILLLTGDFNDRCQSWDSIHNDSELGQRLFDIVTQNNLCQLISGPTRFSEYSESLLDLMITDSPGYVLNSGLLPPISTSDHAVIFCSFSLLNHRDRSFKRTIWDYKRADFDNLNRALQDAPWDTGLTVFDSVDDAVSYWSDLFLDTCKQFIPSRDITIRPKDKPWINNYIKRLIRQRNRAWNRFKRLTCQPRPYTFLIFTKIERFYQLYKKKRNLTSNAIKTSVRSYFEKLRSELDSKDINPKKWWSLSKSILGNKLHQSIPPLVDNGKIISSNIEKCETFNTYFANQCKLPHQDNPLPLPTFFYRTDARLNMFQIDAAQVHKVLLSLKTSSACGPDNIGNILLKNTASGICHPLTKLFNHSLQHSHFPLPWKKSNVCPVFKKNNKQSKENYRPISLLCNVSKVFERLIYNVFYEYLITNNLLTTKNSGFKKNDSTINQLVSILHDIYNGLELSKEARMVFLDISKAFDRVWHEGLLFKLKQLGFTDPVSDFISSYLSDRSQRTTICGQTSAWLPVEAGVPQGSILGPLLFLVFINDITDGISCDIKLFADDTSILEIVHNPNTSAARINTDLGRIHAWGKLWRVTFNAIKSLSVIFSSKKDKPAHPPLFMGDTAIPESHEHTHLGITLTHNLSWQSHITRIINKSSQRLALLRRLKYKLSRKALIRLYLTMIRPILEYGCVLFDNCTDGLSSSLEAVQFEAARICTGALRHTPRLLLLSELGWQTLSDRRKYHKLVLFYKMVNKLTPRYLYDLVPRDIGLTTNLNLRNRLNIRQVKFRTKRYGDSFLPSCIHLWNNLPLDIRQSVSLAIFKSKLKSTLLSVDPKPSYLSHGKRFPNICHTQLRLGCSQLNSHLYKVNIIPSPDCACSFQSEDIHHFFLSCPHFSAHRRHLLDTVCRILAPGVNPKLIIHLCGDLLVTYFLHGNDNLSHEDNIIIFESVQNYIALSRRFEF